MSQPHSFKSILLRKPLPVGRAIWWVPEGWRAAANAGEELPLFVTQGALREVIRHLRSDPDQELLGFLLGNLFEDSEAGVQFLVITGALRTGHVIAEEDRVQIPEEEWLGMQLELRRRRAVLVGWYHSTPFVGPHPVRVDLETHRERFPDPWQTGLVVATGGTLPTGGFFRPSPSDPSGGVFIPFHELADDESLLPGGRKRSLIDWSNYHTDDPVEIDRTERRPHIARRPSPRGVAIPAADAGAASAASAASAAGDEGDARAAGAGRAPPGDGPFAPPPPMPTLPVMIPPMPEGIELPPDYGDYAERRTRWPVAVAVLVVLGVAGGGWWMLTHRGVELPPSVSADFLPRARPIPADTIDTLAPLDTTGLGLAGGSMSATPVAPPAAPPSSSQSATRSAPAQGAPAQSVPPRTVPGAPSRVAPAATDPALARFDSLADSTEQTIRNFHDRDQDFSLHRITCNGLGVGYGAADDSYIKLATSYRGVRDALDAARESRFRAITSAMDTVNTAFDASRCRRP